MQRYGPPPAYPNLRIPGVNAPVPDSVHYGMGKLFTDERGFTVYSDCHGLNKAIYSKRSMQRAHWGELREDEQESEEEEDEEGYGQAPVEEESDEESNYENMRSGVSSMVSDMQTPVGKQRAF